MHRKTGGGCPICPFLRLLEAPFSFRPFSHAVVYALFVPFAIIMALLTEWLRGNKKHNYLNRIRCLVGEITL